MDFKNFSGAPEPNYGQTKQYKEMFPRIIKSQRKSNSQEDDILLKKHPSGPGIFFDMQKGIQYQKIENTKKMIMRNLSRGQSQPQQQQQNQPNQQNQQQNNKNNLNTEQQVIQATAAAAISSAGGLIHLTDKHTQKLYSPYEYLHYATKINFSKESYLTSLQQLGYTNVNNLNAKPYNDIMNKTQNIIQKSYSLKYLGVIDGNMGILSKRVKLSDAISAGSNNNAQADKTKSPQGQRKKKNKINKNKRESESNTINHANISVVPSEYRPDLYNSYLITSYSLPKYLKPILKEKNSQIVEDKQRLEKWHAEQLRKTSNFFQNENVQNDDQNNSISHNINNSISASMSMNAGLTNYIGKIKPKRQNSHRQHSPGQNNNNDLINRYLGESPEDGLSYAIIDKSKEAPMNQSYSRLINTISKRNNLSDHHNTTLDPSFIPQRQKSDNNANKGDNQQQLMYSQSQQNFKSSSMQNINNSIKFTQNQQFHDRFDHIAKYLDSKQKI